MPKTYGMAVCLTCGATIREGAYSGRSGNLAKHIASHEKQGVSGQRYLQVHDNTIPDSGSNAPEEGK